MPSASGLLARLALTAAANNHHGAGGMIGEVVNGARCHGQRRELGHEFDPASAACERCLDSPGK